MDIDIIFENFNKICRLCLSYDELQPIFKLNILDLYSLLTNIQVKSEDKLPSNICQSCSGKLTDISEFIENCKKNDTLLRSVLSKEFERSDHEDNCITSDNIKNESENSNDECLIGSVKEEMVLEPDIMDLKDGSKNCGGCSDLLVSNFDLKELIKCQPRGYTSSPSIVRRDNIVDYLKNNVAVKKTKTKVKRENTKEESEYVKGHKLKGKRQFLCNYCGKNYTRKNGLDRHILSHTGVKRFECKECGKHYMTKDTLKTHLLTHTGVKAYKCQTCQKSFTQSSHLTYHMRRHAGDKPFSCSFCGKSFLSTYHLERHKLMHTGVKPYECEQCGKQFVRSTTLRDHILIHTGEKPFQCQHCGKQFNRKQSLTNHVLVHTGQSKGNSGDIGRNVQSLYLDSNVNTNRF